VRLRVAERSYTAPAKEFPYGSCTFYKECNFSPVAGILARITTVLRMSRRTYAAPERKSHQATPSDKYAAGSPRGPPATVRELPFPKAVLREARDQSESERLDDGDKRRSGRRAALELSVPCCGKSSTFMEEHRKLSFLVSQSDALCCNSTHNPLG